jgi:polar amino acid transport system substrate-binding protein
MPTASITRRLVCASITLWLASCALAAAQSEQEPGDAGNLPRRAAIRFLTDSEFPPFHYYDEDGVLTGFDIDMARAICLELSATCDIKVRAWDDLVPALRRGEADAVIASNAITPQALALVDFTDRYYHAAAWFAGLRGGGRIDITPEGLEGKKIAVVKGTSHEAYLRTFFRNSSVQAFDSVESARDALTTRAVDLLFDDGISLVFWLNGTLSKECCEFKGGPFSDPKFFGDGIAIAVPKTDPQLKGLINRALKRVRETGRYEELLLRYFPSRLY